MHVETWLAEYLGCQSSDIDLVLIAGDASPRRFFRISRSPEHANASSDGLVLMKSPPTENNERFILVQGLLASAGVRVPRLLRADLAQGWFALEDLGDETFYQALATEPAESLYEKALETLAQLAAVPVSEVLPTYDQGRLQTELDVFPEWFLGRALAIDTDDDGKNHFSALCQLLVESALAQPLVMVHRDYHSRNLMVQADTRDLAVIDFQDAVLGPLTYDAVSLLKDCYVVWSREQQLAWLSLYRHQLLQRAVVDTLDFECLVEWFDLMGLQRHIKVLGVFSRLWLRDEKPAYLADLPTVVAYVLDACDRYAHRYQEIRDFQTWFEGQVLPALDQQPWWQGLSR